MGRRSAGDRLHAFVQHVMGERGFATRRAEVGAAAVRRFLSCQLTARPCDGACAPNQASMTTDIKRDWEVRRAGGGDVESLVAMRLRLDDHLVRANPRQLRLSASGRAALPDRYREALADRASCLLVAEGRSTAEVVGMAWGRAAVREDITPSQVGRIDDVWVEPHWRRQGICRGLLNQLLIF